ncbi:MAG: hypothetical protein PHT04_07865 [Eubacteriales bacterium]|jgi:hypothetical protein|nr:hypothetical protein [Eubacteriales bacterium]
MVTVWKKPNKKGVAIVYVIIVLVVVMLFSSLVVNHVYRNLQQAKYQERILQAYYLSLSGTDLCLAALMKEGIGGESDTLLYSHFNPSISTPSPLVDTLYLDGGIVQLSISAATRNGERWIIIESTAVLDNTGETKTTYLDFLYSNPLIQLKR